MDSIGDYTPNDYRIEYLGIQKSDKENEIKDLTNGDGLGLPICKQIALKMKGDLTIDPEFTKGVRFILELHS